MELQQWMFMENIIGLMCLMRHQGQKDRNSGLIPYMVKVIEGSNKHGIKIFSDIKFSQIFKKLYFVLGVKLFSFGNANLQPGEVPLLPSIKEGQKMLARIFQAPENFKNFEQVQEDDNNVKHDLKDFEIKTRENILFIVDYEQNKQLTDQQNQDYLVKKFDEKLDELKLEQPISIFHLTPKNEIKANPIYEKFILKYNKLETKHIFCSSDIELNEQLPKYFLQNIEKNDLQNQNQEYQLFQEEENEFLKQISQKKITPHQLPLYQNYTNVFNKQFPSMFPKIPYFVTQAFQIDETHSEKQNISEIIQNYKLIKNLYVWPPQSMFHVGRENYYKFEQKNLSSTSNLCKFFKPNRLDLISQEMGKQIVSKFLLAKHRNIQKHIPVITKQYTMAEQNKNTDIFPKITTLGTSSSSSTLFRNVTSYMIQLNQNASIMFDCGSGTFQQFLMNLGENQQDLKQELQKIKILFVSHYHTDHHLGISELCQQRKQLGISEPLFIILPNNLLNYYEMINMEIENLNIKIILHSDAEKILPNYEEILKKRKVSKNMSYNPYKIRNQEKSEKLIKNMSQSKSANKKGKQVESDEINHEENEEIIIFQDEEQEGQNQSQNYDFPSYQQEFLDLLKKINIESIQPVPVTHCANACGVVLNLFYEAEKQIKKKYKIVYSGDTRPDKDLAYYGQNADLLIHECTYFDSMIKQANSYNHSAFKEVILLATQMNSDDYKKAILDILFFVPIYIIICIIMFLLCWKPNYDCLPTLTCFSFCGVICGLIFLGVNFTVFYEVLNYEYQQGYYCTIEILDAADLDGKNDVFNSNICFQNKQNLGQESYIAIQYNFKKNKNDSETYIGYGCASDNKKGSLVYSPAPFKYYENQQREKIQQNVQNFYLSSELKDRKSPDLDVQNEISSLSQQERSMGQSIQ
ncbi:hypothetical protein PPERSA_11953 [Pseudocohnilembus persalinus]|uniref:ribonuclease Z n=1 Tax=Pseudocohnilembus persalinus TaxID=266149 RepID=A0A0V0QKU4_PSEPJ|nr:hypothetical protein PPERSA_11953 [Pseudocohnilembus persalinus]|eukprot:KRX02613.1 hypothetical protein PPERSA_11953 [Pseudocohnilembus persalinus]